MFISADREPNHNEDPVKAPSKVLPNQKHKPHPNQDNPLEPEQGI
jgi:hypothetical protein